MRATLTKLAVVTGMVFLVLMALINIALTFDTGIRAATTPTQRACSVLGSLVMMIFAFGPVWNRQLRYDLFQAEPLRRSYGGRCWTR